MLEIVSSWHGVIAPWNDVADGGGDRAVLGKGASVGRGYR